MKKLKENQLGPWCTYCPPKTTRATFRTSIYYGKKHCCDAHMKELRKDEVEYYNREESYTEADYQSWMRL